MAPPSHWLAWVMCAFFWTPRLPSEGLWPLNTSSVAWTWTNRETTAAPFPASPSPTPAPAGALFSSPVSLAPSSGRWPLAISHWGAGAYRPAARPRGRRPGPMLLADSGQT
ncbi:MAG: hypothetical protein M5U01_18800 [Ardenticatenaceae bacterium]|nr:hypothetical protein [Ardenticatenaceae bacterium]